MGIYTDQQIGDRITVKPGFEHAKPGLYEVRGTQEIPGINDLMITCEQIIDGTIYSEAITLITMFNLLGGIVQGLVEVRKQG